MITAPYPYLARTIWGDTDTFDVHGHAVSPAWRGDFERYRATYWSRWQNEWAYTQGDFACATGTAASRCMAAPMT